MAEIIATGGGKGGSGKTSLAHALAHGLGSLPSIIPAAVVVMEARTPIPTAPGRRYVVLDGSTPEAYQKNVVPLFEVEKAIVVLDGMANNQRFDELAANADLMLIPLDWSFQGLTYGREDLQRFPDAVGVPNAWPKEGTAEWKRLADEAARIPADRLLERMPSVPKLDIIAYDREYHRHAASLAPPCKRFALNVLARLGKHPFDYR